MRKQTMFAIISIIVALSVAAIAPAMMSTARAASDNFSKTGNPHEQPGAGNGDPHIDHKTGNPHRCPGSNC